MLEVRFSNYSKKFLKKNKNSDLTLVKKIIGVIDKLLLNPLPTNSKKLASYPYYRVRVGDYRIVYRHDKKFLYIALIEKRGKVYDSLKNIN